MQFIEDEIQGLVKSIWESILHLPLERTNKVPTGEARTMAACVHITGAWEGAVALNCGAEFAGKAADIMFCLGGATPSTSDLQDALGELVNMIGGNIKGLLPETSQLSLPAVVEGTDYSIRVPGSRVVTTVPFKCENQVMNVSLLQKIAKAA